MTDEDAAEFKPRWWLIGGVTLLGAVVVATPFYLSWCVNGDFGSSHSLMSSTLTNVGTTLLLAAFLVLVERRFVARAERTARRVVDQKTEEFRQETEAIRQRLDALQERVAERTASAEAAGAAVVDQISSNLSYETVTGALELANDVEALWHSALTVPTNEAADAPAVYFSWTASQSGGRFDDVDNLKYTLLLMYKHHPGERNPSVDIEWRRGVPADEVIHQLKELMVKAGYGEPAQALDEEHMFARFSQGIRDAIAGKRAKPGAWLNGCGKLDELVGPNLAITSLGVAADGHGLILKVSDFPERQFPLAAAKRAAMEEYKLPSPPAPRGVDPSHWTVAIKRAARQHPRARWSTAASLPPTGFPVTSANTPVNRG